MTVAIARKIYLRMGKLQPQAVTGILGWDFSIVMDLTISFFNAANSFLMVSGMEPPLSGVMGFPIIAAMRNNAGWIVFSWAEVFMFFLIWR